MAAAPKKQTEQAPSEPDEPDAPDVPEETAASPEAGLTGTGDLSKKGLDNESTGTPVRRYTFENGYGAKVYAGQASGEFTVAPLSVEGRVLRHVLPGRSLPASLDSAGVNEVLEGISEL